MTGAAPQFRFRLIAPLFLVLLWAACSDQASGPAALDVLNGPALAVTQREIERGLPSALRLQSQSTDELLALPGVVGTAVALGDDGLPTVAALVEHGGVRVPRGVRVIVTGKFSALDWQVQPQGRPKCGKGKLPECDPGDPPDDPDPDPPPSAHFARPVPIGVSTGHPAITAGTIGARVTDGSSVWALSNNHVYAATNFLDCDTNDSYDYDCAIGDPVIQPGTFDGGTPGADNIGTLAAFQPIDFSATTCTNIINIMDAAIAFSNVQSDLLGNATPSAGYGTPQSTTMAAALKMKVKKFARTTGLTKGQVAAVNATVMVDYGDPGVACFKEQIIITPGTFSAGGDSGGAGRGRRQGPFGERRRPQAGRAPLCRVVHPYDHQPDRSDPRPVQDDPWAEGPTEDRRKLGGTRTARSFDGEAVDAHTWQSVPDGTATLERRIVWGARSRPCAG